MGKRLLVVLSIYMVGLCGLTAVAAPLIGNPDAPVGGTQRLALPIEPSNLNPLKGVDLYALTVESACLDSLLDRNIETFEWIPSVAEKWEVAKDGKSITFTLRKGVTFHDGTPLTVEDVKFSFEVNFDADLADAVRRAEYENIEKAEILGPDKIKFHIKKPYFKNLDVLAGLTILPKIHYGDKNKKMTKTIIGSGAYMLDKYEQGKSITLKRNPKWWGFNLPEYKGYNKVEKVVYEFIKDDNARLETFKKGDLDYTDLTAEQFEKKTEGPMWGTTVFKKQAENSAPKGLSYVGFNLRNKLFNDKNVRLAMVKLFDRKMLINKFLFGKAVLAAGPYYPQSPAVDPEVKPVLYDVTGARELLKKAGWADPNKKGVLEKNIDGQPVEFHFAVTIPSGGQAEKYMTVYQEELKKSGIKMDIKVVDWSTFLKILDDRSFECVALGVTGNVDPDMHQTWHSESDVKGGSNVIGYKNPEVDKLIDQVKFEMDRSKRLVLQRKVYRLIAEDYPEIFMWSPKYEFYAHSKRMKMVKPTYKYGVGVGTWWIEE